MTGFRERENAAANMDVCAHLQVVRGLAGPSAASMDVPVGEEAAFSRSLNPLSCPKRSLVLVGTPTSPR